VFAYNEILLSELGTAQGGALGLQNSSVITNCSFIGNSINTGLQSPGGMRVVALVSYPDMK
jgi:hypothetical protein